MVRIPDHPEPVEMVSIERLACAGGGLLLVIDRHDGELDRLLRLLNEENRKENDCL